MSLALAALGFTPAFAFAIDDGICLQLLNKTISRARGAKTTGVGAIRFPGFLGYLAFNTTAKKVHPQKH
jgi:hypothetical protein